MFQKMSWVLNQSWGAREKPQKEQISVERVEMLDQPFQKSAERGGDEIRRQRREQQRRR